MALQVGDVIFKCGSYAHVLFEPELKIRCHFCLRSSTKMLTCSGCQVLNYCNSQCKESDWTLHHIECQCLQNMAPECPTDSTRLLIRLIIRMKIGDHRKMFEDNKIFQRQFIDLMSHFNELQIHNICYDEDEIARCAKNCLELPSTDTLLEIYGKLLTNSFAITDVYLSTVGAGIYLSTSILNHSCAPNAVVGFNSTDQTVYALLDIPEVRVDKICISYIDAALPSWMRRELLWDRFFFYCHCHWCDDYARYIDHIMTSALCPVPGCLGFTGLTRNKKEIYEMLPCSKCGQAEFSPDYEKSVKDIWNYGNECCDKMKIMENKEEFENLLSFAENVLQEFKQIGIMHESNLLYIRVRECAIVACTELDLWAKAAEYAEEVLPQKRKCIPNADYVMGTLLIELGKFYVNDHNISEARRVFHEAKGFVVKSHGLKNGSYKEIQSLFEMCDEIETLHNSDLFSSDDANNNNKKINPNVKKVLNRIKFRISKALPRKIHMQVPSFFSSRRSNTTKRHF